MNRTRAIVVACALSTSSTMNAQVTQWPTIRSVEVRRTYDVSPSRPTDTPLRLILRDVTNEPAYRLECHNADYDGDPEYDYSGNFQCALFALKGNSRASWNLLATNDPVQQKSDWMNRGRMLAWQLYGDCGAVPNYGRIRHFRLRRMLLTIQFENLRWRAGTRPLDPVLDGFTVHVRASPDPTARTQTAAPAPLKIDPESCDFVPGG